MKNREIQSTLEMELTLRLRSVQAASFPTPNQLKIIDCHTLQRNSLFLVPVKLKRHRKTTLKVSSALAETAASVAVAATVVGAAATILARRIKASSEVTEVPSKPCEDCGGSGLCPECKGEGFTLKKLSDGSADKARLNAKNMATRYTAGLPKKWSYCTKCSSARNCRSCEGSGKILL